MCFYSIHTLIKEVFLKILNGKPVSFNFFTIVMDLSKSSTTPVAAMRKSGWKTERWNPGFILMYICVFTKEGRNHFTDTMSLLLEFEFRIYHAFAWQMQIDLLQPSWGAAAITFIPFTNNIFRAAILITLAPTYESLLPTSLYSLYGIEPYSGKVSKKSFLYCCKSLAF